MPTAPPDLRDRPPTSRVRCRRPCRPHDRGCRRRSLTATLAALDAARRRCWPRCPPISSTCRSGKPAPRPRPTSAAIAAAYTKRRTRSGLLQATRRGDPAGLRRRSARLADVSPRPWRPPHSRRAQGPELLSGSAADRRRPHGRRDPKDLPGRDVGELRYLAVRPVDLDLLGRSSPTRARSTPRAAARRGSCRRPAGSGSSSGRRPSPRSARRCRRRPGPSGRRSASACRAMRFSSRIGGPLTCVISRSGAPSRL